jgi:hypothetical protein
LLPSLNCTTLSFLSNFKWDCELKTIPATVAQTFIPYKSSLDPFELISTLSGVAKKVTLIGEEVQRKLIVATTIEIYEDVVVPILIRRLKAKWIPFHKEHGIEFVLQRNIGSHSIG